MKAFFADQWVTGRLEPRDAFLGGRSQTFKLTAEPDTAQGEELCYWDFCSPYPWVCSMVASFPRGQPMVIVEDVLCPRNLYYPTIGYRHEGRLLFANYRSCMETAEKGESHDGRGASLPSHGHRRGTLGCPRSRYQVLKTYELWKCEDSCWEKGGLFKEFIAGFKIKKFASIAPKVYGLRLEDEAENVEISLKVKGVTMDSEAAKKVTFEKMEEMAHALMDGLPLIEVKTVRMMITKPRMGAVSTSEVTKTLKAVMSKVRLLPDGTTTPFGYKEL